MKYISMGFKKTNIKKKSHLISNFVGLIALIIVFFLGLILLKSINFLNISLNGDTEIRDSKVKVEEIISSDADKINILLVGRGGGNHDAPNLTDTIILTSINTIKKTISLYSLPRDLYVEYNDESNGKLNGIYATENFKTGSETKGMKKLTDKISEITGEQIDYFANVDFKGFIKVVDAIGGIELSIPKKFVDSQYPDGKGGYRTLIFKQGTWLFEGENALKYVRSRHSTSDFDRSLRQQQVLKAMKEKLSASYFLKSPQKIRELYDIFKKYVFTDMEFSDILKIVYQLKVGAEYQLLSFNLNDSCFYGSLSCAKGGFLYVPNREFFGGMSVLLADGTNVNNLSNYKGVQKYTNIIFNYPEVYQENHKINIFNSIGVNYLASSFSNDVLKYGFNIPKKNSIGNTTTPYINSVIYYNNIPEDSVTLHILKDFYSGDFIRTEVPKYSNEMDTKIEIVIGEDYETIFNF